MKSHMHPDAIRTLFSQAMSDMYQAEVPQYGTLIELVRDVNAQTLAADPSLQAQIEAAGEFDRLDIERHGAIRLGTPAELSAIRRMFAVMGMFPVGYYDLSVAGIPVHSTAFRPIDQTSLSRNPFRVFTSLLRLDLIEDRDLAIKAKDILDSRQIVTDKAFALIDQAEQNGGLTQEQAAQFVAQALETFRWHSKATVNSDTYHALAQAHRLIADVVCFKGPHINHLTPRTLNIDAVQAQMPDRGITPKAVIEGPPRRKTDILLRQTSFKALEEAVIFQDQTGSHTARFGEIEQRGVALTAKGRAVYDQTLTQARETAARSSNSYETVLKGAFNALPDTWEALRAKGLAFFKYRVGDHPVSDTAASVSALLNQGCLIAEPQIYEDFLPVSAAGIFQSNLKADDQSNYEGSPNQQAFETALGAKVVDEIAHYAKIERESLHAALTTLKQTHLM